MDCERVESAEKRRGDFLRVVPFVFRCGVVKNVVFQSTYLCSLLLYKNPLLFLEEEEEEEETTGREHVHTHNGRGSGMQTTHTRYRTDIHG